MLMLCNFLTINYNIYSAYCYLMTCINCIVEAEKYKKYQFLMKILYNYYRGHLKIINYSIV